MFDSRNTPNWIGTQNPWLMPRPPVHWLRKLWDRDDQLRILPGLVQPCYRVARVSNVMRFIRPMRGNDSETGRMCREGLIPVVTLRPTIVFNDDFFLWLDLSDTWGIPRVADHIEEQERLAAEKQDAAISDEAEQIAISSYDALKWRTGQQVIVQAPDVDDSKQPGSPSHAAPGQVT